MSNSVNVEAHGGEKLRSTTRDSYQSVEFFQKNYSVKEKIKNEQPDAISEKEHEKLQLITWLPQKVQIVLFSVLYFRLSGSSLFVG